MSDWEKELTGRVLVLVAHADDECVGYGALLQRMREATLVIATSGAPRDPYFWQRFGSREAYRDLRAEEARRAARLAGVKRLVLLAEQDDQLEDQRLFLNLPRAYELLRQLAAEMRPEAIATLAYEGGHPDHDSCSILGARLAREQALPIWEAPLYHRGAAPDGAEAPIQLQRFLWQSGEEVELQLTDAEVERKRAICAQYASQGEVLRSFDVRRELLRPQVRYDYSCPPHGGPVNYEAWQWWMSARQVCQQFTAFLGA
jgi:LmbE family N-acetylglucosaminyl deacetylase